MLPTGKFIVTACFLFILFPAMGQTGTIRGNLFDQVSKDPLPAANITLQHTSYHTRADEKGNFTLAHIQPGEYDLFITNVGYTDLHKHVVVKAGETTKVYLGLALGGQAMEEVTVFGRADREKETGSRDRERNAVNMINVISAQAMVRSPDISAANVLQRMSGVTIQRSSGGDEAYAIIRGMEPRYNNTLLNGIKIASPDNKSRYVQLGIIPSDILSSIEVSKTLTPDMEGDATGGTVNMVVRDALDKTSFKATASVGYSQLYFDEKYLTFHKGDIQSQSPFQRNGPNYTLQSSDFSRSNADFHSLQAPPTGQLGFSFTHRFMHDRLGFVLADNVQNQYYGNISFQANVTPGNDTTGRLYPSDANNFKEYTQQLNNGLVAHLDYVIDEKNKINLDNFYLYSYLAQSRIDVNHVLIGTGAVSYSPTTGQYFPAMRSQTQTVYVENLKLSGQHILTSAFKVDWAGVYSSAGARTPDQATVNTAYLIGLDSSHNLYQTGTVFEGMDVLWQKNDDKEYSGHLDLDYHKQLNNSNLEFKAGGLYRYSSRANTEDDYSLVNNSKPIFTNIYAAWWDFILHGSYADYNPNDYKATETIYDGYAMVRLKSVKWEAGGGLRGEHTDDVWNLNTPLQFQLNNGSQTYTDLLPSGYLKFWFSSRENLHAAYYRSISRPNYYELVPTAGSQSTTTNVVAEGNPFVQHSVADNFDIRYELFPKGEQHLFIGGFYKHITNPIELQIDTNGTGAGLYRLKPLNSYPANNLGAEVSFTEYWGRFGVSGNYTYTHSSISSDQKTFQGHTVRLDRPMQGQTEHIGNLSLLYKDTKHGAFVQVSYEYQGRTLAATGEYAGADYYQRPMNTLAVSGEKDIHKHFTVFAKLNNLLNTPVKQYVQNILVLQNTYRATYLLGVRYEY
ncbi:MAG TPA: outer membrane beta-barrel protein [Puia sp.]|nr:outer membrane beta-barrel protein [Puia sp.]